MLKLTHRANPMEASPQTPTIIPHQLLELLIPTPQLPPLLGNPDNQPPTPQPPLLLVNLSHLDNQVDPEDLVNQVDPLQDNQQPNQLVNQPDKQLVNLQREERGPSPKLE